MDKENIKKIVNEYLEHVRRYSWQYGVSDEEKLNRFLKSDVVKKLTIPDVSDPLLKVPYKDGEGYHHETGRSEDV